ncbi:MAG: hypothetical protein U0M21_10580 [Emergencia sp.]|nr:hypothetical protein [Emergencia sp.]
MSLQDVSVKNEYRSLIDNVVQEFYIPLLEQAKVYKRAVGFFSSSSLVEIMSIPGGFTPLFRRLETIVPI